MNLNSETLLLPSSILELMTLLNEKIKKVDLAEHSLTSDNAGNSTLLSGLTTAQIVESITGGEALTLKTLNTSLTEFIARVDNPHNVTKAQVGLGFVQNYPIATKVQAEAGAVDNVYMTPIRVKEAISQFMPDSAMRGEISQVELNDSASSTEGFITGRRLQSAISARISNMGLGNVARLNIGTTVGTVAAVDDFYKRVEKRLKYFT